jgi:ribosome-binding protein aMBF1 (putative translation factor)
VINAVREEYAVYMVDSEKVSDDWFASDLQKEISERMTPGSYVRHYREAHSLTQKQLGAKVGVNANYVSDWENGHRQVSRFAARKLATLFGVNPGIFV